MAESRERAWRVESAAGLGFEPRYTAPKAVVLPLDDPALSVKPPNGQACLPLDDPAMW